MGTEGRFILSEKVSRTECGAGVSRQIMGYDDNLMLVKIDFRKGGTGAMHSHPHAQSSYIADGKFEVTIDGETRILETGDGYFVAPGLEHGVRCLENGTLIDTFCPCRKDFL